MAGRIRKKGRRRKRVRKRRINPVRAALVLALLAGFFILVVSGLSKLAGAVRSGFEKKREDSGVYSVEIKKDGSIIDTVYESFDNESYDEDALTGMVNDAIASYNQAGSGEEAVRLLSLKFPSKMVRLQIKYRSVEDYNKFNGENLVIGDTSVLSEKIAAGLKFVEGGDVSSDSGELSEMDAGAVIVNNDVKLILPSDIIAWSGNVTLDGKRSARLKKGEESSAVLFRGNLHYGF